MLLPDPLRNGYTIHTHHLRWSLSTGEEHPLILGAVVARVHLIHIGALVRQEAAPLLTLGSRTTWIHDRDEQLGAGMEGGGKERNIGVRKLA